MPKAHLIAEARALFHRAPSRRTWDDLCSLLDRSDLSTPESSDALRYCEGHLARWPDGLRVAPARWVLRRLDGARVPQLATARAASLSLEGATQAQVLAFCDAPESANLRRLDILDGHTTHGAIDALTGAALTRDLEHVGHCISQWRPAPSDSPLEHLTQAPPPSWLDQGVLALDHNYIDTAKALRGPGARAIRSISGAPAGITCSAISRSDAPLNLVSLDMNGSSQFDVDDAALLSHRLLPRLRALSLSLSNALPTRQLDPLTALDDAGILAPLSSLTLHGAHPRSARHMASCAPEHLSLAWPQARNSGKLLAGQGRDLRALQLRFGSFRGGLAGSDLSSLRSLDVHEATLSIEDYEAVAQAPLTRLTFKAIHAGHQGHRLEGLPPGLRAIVEAPMNALRVFETHELGTDEVTPHDITHAEWFSSLERLSISRMAPGPDHRLQRASLVSAFATARAPSLHTLNLSSNHLSDADVMTMSRLSSPLRRLLLARNAVEDAASLSRYDLSGLRELDLSHNPTRSDTLGALIRSGALSAIERLGLDAVASRAGDVSSIFTQADLPRLHALSLRRCVVSLEDAITLRDSVLAGLSALDLSHARFGEGALELLMSARECASLVLLSLDDAQLANIPTNHALSPRLAACLRHGR